MRKVMRPKYYCDHCNKGGGSGGHIKRHEAACTKNPARVCRMCPMLDHTQTDLQHLMALLPAREQQLSTEYSEDGGHSWETWRDIDEAIIKALREEAGGCPACMMAALRQKGLPVPTATGFNFTAECKAIWADINNRAYEEEMQRERAYGAY